MCYNFYMRKRLVFFMLFPIYFSCSNVDDKCNFDIDCPSNLVCREHRCVSLYENIDIITIFDISNLDYENGSDASIDYKEIEEVLDIEEMEIGDDTLEDINEDSISEVESEVDGSIKECNSDKECVTSLPCTEGRCNKGICEEVVKENYCLIDNKCFEIKAIDPENECLYCNPYLNQYGWSQFDDGMPCLDDNNECTLDICISGTCTHNKYVSRGEKCKGGYCDGQGRCVQCLSDNHCDNSGFDIRCEGYYCSEGLCKYYSREGLYCGNEENYECFICKDKKCVCNSPNFECNNCTPSCGVIKGNCCPQDSTCSGEWGNAYDCTLCCKGECIPY